MTISTPIRTGLTAAALATAALISNVTSAQAVEVTVTIDNLSPEQGLVLTPFWVGFHAGDYDLYEPGRPASEGLELIAEDGDVMPLSEAFLAGGEGRVDGLVTGVGLSPGTPPLIAPGTAAVFTLEVSPSQPYLSYASMILPSNDGFIGNESATSHRVFDAEGNFIGADFVVTGGQVLDAGTEVNDESPESVPLLGMAHGVGPVENATVRTHPGFTPGGNILAAYPNAAFDQSLYPLARIRVTLAQ